MPAAFCIALSLPTSWKCTVSRVIPLTAADFKQGGIRLSEATSGAGSFDLGAAVIGKLTLTDQQFFGAYELGYTLRRDCWGNGYTVEAARAVMEYGFTKKGVRRITAETDVQNVRSRRVLEKLGMRQEGIFVKSAAYQTGDNGEPVWSDYCAYAILREEFLK